MEFGTCDHCGAQTVDGNCTKVMELKFAKVQNKDHWKGPIDALVDFNELREVQAAIVHYTATEGTWEDVGKVRGIRKVRVTAPGYWAGPAN